MCQLALLRIPLNPGDLSQAGHSEVTPCWMNEVNLWPFRLPSLRLCQPCILAAGVVPKSLNMKVVECRGWVGGGVGYPVLLVGQRYGSGNSKSPVRLYCESRGKSRVAEAGGKRRRNGASRLPPPVLVCSSAPSPVISLSWRTRWLPSAAASPSDCWH